MVEWGQRIIEKKGLKDMPLAMRGAATSTWRSWDSRREGQWQKVREAEEEIVSFALKCGRTATGEHGIGIGKKKFMEKEHGESLL